MFAVLPLAAPGRQRTLGKDSFGQGGSKAVRFRVNSCPFVVELNGHD
jgi:hypothetical protein